MQSLGDQAAEQSTALVQRAERDRSDPPVLERADLQQVEARDALEAKQGRERDADLVGARDPLGVRSGLGLVGAGPLGHIVGGGRDSFLPGLFGLTGLDRPGVDVEPERPDVELGQRPVVLHPLQLALAPALALRLQLGLELGDPLVARIGTGTGMESGALVPALLIGDTGARVPARHRARLDCDALEDLFVGPTLQVEEQPDLAHGRLAPQGDLDHLARGEPRGPRAQDREERGPLVRRPQQLGQGPQLAALRAGEAQTVEGERTLLRSGELELDAPQAARRQVAQLGEALGAERVQPRVGVERRDPGPDPDALGELAREAPAGAGGERLDEARRGRPGQALLPEARQGPLAQHQEREGRQEDGHQKDPGRDPHPAPAGPTGLGGGPIGFHEREHEAAGTRDVRASSSAAPA